MVTLDKAHIARIKVGKQIFEILVDSDKAIAFKSGKISDIRDVLAVEKIFSDAKRGGEVSPILLKECFGSEDVLEVAKQIVMKGDFALTTEYKAQLKEQKRRQIINMIHQNAVDPQTHTPHPPARIEAAMDEAKVHIDEFEDVTKQVQEVLKKIRVVLPIKFEMKEINVIIPAKHAPKSYGIVKGFGTKLKEDWLQDGSLSLIIEIPGGLEQDLYDKLNSVCHGELQSKVLKIK